MGLHALRITDCVVCGLFSSRQLTKEAMEQDLCTGQLLLRTIVLYLGIVAVVGHKARTRAGVADTSARHAWRLQASLVP